MAFSPYYEQELELQGYFNETKCLSEPPRVVRVQRRTSTSIYLDNAAYRTFIYDKFKVSPVDMESVIVALICLQQRVPFIIIRALSDLAGGGSADSNEADTFHFSCCSQFYQGGCRVHQASGRYAGCRHPNPVDISVVTV